MIEGTCHCGTASWQLTRLPNSATACNCTTCRRYGVLWAYGYEGEDIAVSGETSAYTHGESLSFNFCSKCGCVMHWRSLDLNDEGRRRVAVNLRMAEPEPISQVLIRHFDGLESWQSLPADGRCIKDMWF